MKKVINLLLITILLLSITAVTGAQATGTPFTATGQVIDRDGNPIAGADVTLVDYDYNTISVKKTNENGDFTFANIAINTNSFKVLVQYTAGNGVVYKMPPTYANWHNGVSIVDIPTSETQISTYPPPIYGYVWGSIGTSANTGNTPVTGIAYLVSSDSNVKYYLFDNRTDDKGGYYFLVPPGQYWLYAQHWDTGIVYESAHTQVTVTADSSVTDVQPTHIVLPLNSPASDPDPPVMPTSHVNVVNGTVLTQDQKPWKGATVTLLERADNGSAFVPIKGADGNPLTTVTDANGKYQFYGVSPTSNDNNVIQSNKDIKIQVDYSDLNGTQHTYVATSQETRPLYYADVILGYGQENAARSITMPTVTLPFAQGGWVNLNSIPQGANIYVDGQELSQSDGTPLTTPCTVYIDAGTHQLTLSKDGYSDYTDSIIMVANTQHRDYLAALQKALLPSWVKLLTAVIIVIIVVMLLVVLLATRVKYLLAPFSRLFGGFRHTMDDRKASNDISRAHRAEAAEQHRLERQRHADARASSRREPVRERYAPGNRIDSRDAGARAEAAPRDDVDFVNVDPVKRRHEPKVFEDSKRVFEGSKKIFDLKHIADNVPKKIKPRETVDPQKDKSSMVFANDIYKKPNTNVERIPYESASRPAYNERVERETFVEHQPPAVPQRSERIRVPKTPQQREVSSTGEKERVLKYIRDHPEGVSFIQMSNDLEIIPNNLTYITKELVINDDIDKVKGLYYYKSHASPAEDSSSSVVVWRLDGDK